MLVQLCPGFADRNKKAMARLLVDDDDDDDSSWCLFCHCLSAGDVSCEAIRSCQSRNILLPPKSHLLVDFIILLVCCEYKFYKLWSSLLNKVLHPLNTFQQVVLKLLQYIIHPSYYKFAFVGHRKQQAHYKDCRLVGCVSVYFVRYIPTYICLLNYTV